MKRLHNVNRLQMERSVYRPSKKVPIYAKRLGRLHKKPARQVEAAYAHRPTWSEKATPTQWASWYYSRKGLKGRAAGNAALRAGYKLMDKLRLRKSRKTTHGRTR
jgi:hypothetical protein